MCIANSNLPSSLSQNQYHGFFSSDIYSVGCYSKKCHYHFYLPNIRFSIYCILYWWVFHVEHWLWHYHLCQSFSVCTTVLPLLVGTTILHHSNGTSHNVPYSFSKFLYDLTIFNCSIISLSNLSSRCSITGYSMTFSCDIESRSRSWAAILNDLWSLNVICDQVALGFKY